MVLDGVYKEAPNMVKLQNDKLGVTQLFPLYKDADIGIDISSNKLIEEKLFEVVSKLFEINGSIFIELRRRL